MTWQIPTWWAFTLLALAAFRTWRLIAEDTITEGLRNRIDADEEGKRSLFLRCPWCCGAWCSILWWIAWIAWPHWTLIVATPFAISALVGLIAANIDPVD